MTRGPASEAERIEAIRRRLSSPDAHVRIGIGDDAAVLAALAAPVLSVDASVEGVHFRLDWARLEDVGRRAVVAAVSDLAAMGASPRAALISLVLPPAMDDDELARLVDGIAGGAQDNRLPVVGGNLSAGRALSITTTVVGELEGEPLLRSGARPGDGVYVTGTVGDAALGLALLSAGRGDDPGDDDAARFVACWRRPSAQLQIAARLRGAATAAIDVSDGLLADLGHVCAASGVGAVVDAAQLPLSRGFDAVARRLGLDPLAVALGGGEGYNLLFTAPADTCADELGTRVGRVTADVEVVVRGEDGARVDVDAPGFSHF